VLKLAVFLEMI